jgi:hypothetical protein
LSSHRFDRRDGRIEATPITEPPFDPILADTFVSELRTKLAEALDSLTGNNADEIVRRAIMRLSDLLRVSSSEMAEGILLMRANTLAAYNRAYSDPSSERERAIRAVLDDVSSSVDDLVQCFPGIRQISANRLALDMQTDRANEVEAVIQEVAELARKNAGVGPSTPAALDTGRDEVEDVSEKLASETSLERIADYIATRGDIVASRLLNATNFISATLQGAGRELAGISSDTWKEIRKTLPKATARGVSKGTEKAVEILVEKGTNFAIVGLAYVVAGPLGALAVLVPRLRGHAKKAEEIKDEVKKALGHEQ